MSDLLVRKVPPRMKRELKARARAHGRSLSEETKLVIEKGLRAREPEMNMGDWLFNLVRPEDRGDDLVFEYPDNFPKPADFE
jgi:plasmid stability protein